MIDTDGKVMEATVLQSHPVCGLAKPSRATGISTPVVA
jgi:hypothetical protein